MVPEEIQTEAQSNSSCDASGDLHPSCTQSVCAPTFCKSTGSRSEVLLWWRGLKLCGRGLLVCLQPLVWLGFLACAIFLLGVAQQRGWFPVSEISGGGHGGGTAVAGGWICPMMCTAAVQRAGRCPVCAMELVPATGSVQGAAASGSVQIDAAARRVANIQTVPVGLATGGRVVRAVGRLDYDEGTRRTLSARVDGRIEKLFADYTGVVVQAGDCLAIVYSPLLYAAQVEFLLARGGGAAAESGAAGSVRGSLYESSRRRLLELGMTEQQVEQLEVDGEASSRLELEIGRAHV